jgi:hypothetical protein
MMTAFSNILLKHSKLILLLVLFQAVFSIKNTDTKSFLTEKSNSELNLVETYQEMAQSKLQLATRLKLKAKMMTISSYLIEYSEIVFSDEEIKAIKLNTMTNSQTGKATTNEIFAYYNKNDHRLEFHEIEKKNVPDKVLVAKGVYDRTRYQTGWDKLGITTFSDVNPLIQCYTAGLLEGVLSYQEIYNYYHNIHVFFYGEENYIQDIKKFYKKIDTNIKKRVNEIDSNKFNSDDDFLHWSYITCLNAQINGLHTGYNMIADIDKALDLYDFYFINSEGNFGDLKVYMEISEMKFDSVENDQFYTDENLKKFYNTSNIEEIWKNLMKKGHCSALTKLVKTDDGLFDILAGHNTWSDYSEMLRTLKTVNMAFEGNSPYLGMKPKKINYSSYPGVLFSGDDFYQIDSKIVILQTTLSVINKFIYRNTIDIENYIPEFMRLMIINYTSNSGQEWKENYKFYKNHMYITQWIVVDYKVLDKINKDLKRTQARSSHKKGYSNLNTNSADKIAEKYKDSGLILLIEEVPTSISWEDVSQYFLKNGYYGSFNIAYFPRHQELIGLSHYKQIDLTSKRYNPRFYIFKTLQQNVKNLSDFERLIQYNGFQSKNEILPDDPSYSDSNSGISSRGDYSSFSDYHGGIDFKIVNKKLVDEMKFYAYGGPTYLYNNNFTPFDFSKVTDHRTLYRKGIPSLWDFKPFIYS